MRDSYEPDLQAQAKLEDLRSFLLTDVREGGKDILVRGVFDQFFPDLKNRPRAYRVLYGAREGHSKAHEPLTFKNKLVILVSGFQDEWRAQAAVATHAKAAGARKVCIFMHGPFLNVKTVSEIAECAATDYYVVTCPPVAGLGIIAGCGKFRCLFPDRPHRVTDYTVMSPIVISGVREKR